MSPVLRESFEERLKLSDFSETAVETLIRSFDGIGTNLQKLKPTESGSSDEVPELEKSWYIARVGSKYRFLTRIRLSPTRFVTLTHLRNRSRHTRCCQPSSRTLSTSPGPDRLWKPCWPPWYKETRQIGPLRICVSAGSLFRDIPSSSGSRPLPDSHDRRLQHHFRAIGLTKMGLPFSIVCVAPLIFGFGIHNGIHVVMGSLHEKGGSVARTVAKLDPALNGHFSDDHDGICVNAYFSTLLPDFPRTNYGHRHVSICAVDPGHFACFAASD